MKNPDVDLVCARAIVFMIYLITGCILIYRVRICLYECVDKHFLAMSIAYCFVGLTIPISVYHTWEHLNYFTRPRLQSQIVRIIWMVPVFSLESLCSVIWVDKAFYFQAFREIYEAYVIYCFMRYLIHYLGDEKYLAIRLSTMPASMGHHKPPFCCLHPWTMGNDFLRRCKAGVFQYVVIRFSLTVLALILRVLGLYIEGNYSIRSWVIWMTIINCLSQTWALYSLLLFFHCSQKDLLSMKPLPKFLCIKAVVFFSWWQALAVELLVKFGHINDAHGHTAHEVATLIEDLLICMEMLVAAVAFLNSFPVSDFYSALGRRVGRPGLRNKVLHQSQNSRRLEYSTGSLGIAPVGDMLSAAISTAQSRARANRDCASATAESAALIPALASNAGGRGNEGLLLSSDASPEDSGEDIEGGATWSAALRRSSVMRNFLVTSSVDEIDGNAASSSMPDLSQTLSSTSFGSHSVLIDEFASSKSFSSSAVTSIISAGVSSTTGGPGSALPSTPPVTHSQIKLNSSSRDCSDDPPGRLSAHGCRQTSINNVDCFGPHAHCQSGDAPSAMHALWASSIPEELLGDIQDLSLLFGEAMVTQPSNMMRKWLKGSSGHS